MRWRDFAQQNADKILLIVVLHGIMILMISDLKNPTLVDWLRGEASTVLGALIMLITGRSTKPEPAVTTTTTSTLTVVPPESPQPVPAPAEPLTKSGIERD